MIVIAALAMCVVVDLMVNDGDDYGVMMKIVMGKDAVNSLLIKQHSDTCRETKT